MAVRVTKTAGKESAEGTPNWFAYCGGDPVNYTDESGCERKVKLRFRIGAGALIALLFEQFFPAHTKELKLIKGIIQNALTAFDAIRLLIAIGGSQDPRILAASVGLALGGVALMCLAMTQVVYLVMIVCGSEAEIPQLEGNLLEFFGGPES